MTGFIFACHGAACGILLLLAGLLWRDQGRRAAGRVSAGLALGAAAYAILSAPGVRPGAAAWQVLVMMLACGNPAVFWLWARFSFDDDFVLRRWHAAPWIALAGGGLVLTYAGDWPGMAVLQPGLQVLSGGLALLALAQTFATWRDDLVAGRRRLRLVILAGIAAYIVTDALAGLIPARVMPTPFFIDAVRATGLVLLAVLASSSRLRAGPDRDAALLPAGGGVPSAPPIENPGSFAADPALLRRLEQAMTVERIYRTEGLTIGSLAGRLCVPEHRLRQAINAGLGYRNFSAFLNAYRIAEAKAALADPDQKAVPVLTIALDAGFQSIGPFNRAFKAETGMTPSEYRRLALAKPVSGAAGARADSEIGKPG